MIRNHQLEDAVAREIRRMQDFIGNYADAAYATHTPEQLIAELQHATTNLIEFCHQQTLNVNYN